MQKKVSYIFRKRFSSVEVNKVIIRLRSQCLLPPIQLNENAIVKKRSDGVKQLIKMLPHIDFGNIEIYHLNVIVWSALACVQYFYTRIDMIELSRIYRFRSKRAMYNKALQTYMDVVKHISRHHCETLIHSIFAYLSESKLWKLHYLCRILLQKVVTLNRRLKEKGIECLLDTIDQNMRHENNFKIARCILLILYQLMDDLSSLTFELVHRIFTMFHHSILKSHISEYNYINCGFEVCVRRIIRNMPDKDLLVAIRFMIGWTLEKDISDEYLFVFGSILEYAAMLHKTILYRNSLTAEIFALIIELIVSKNRLHSLLGNRILQHILNRQNNKCLFDPPVLFTEDALFNIRIGNCDINDRMFMEYYRATFHNTILSAITQHGMHRMNLETIFTTLSLLVVEVPCGYTAAAIVCLAMNIQDYTLAKDEEMSFAAAHRLHATVISLISLICWVHNAKVFYEYINVIIARRAQIAPHLNPPLRSTYQYEQHHVLYNKKDLFLEQWEVRFGLWKCFRSMQLNALFT